SRSLIRRRCCGSWTRRAFRRISHCSSVIRATTCVRRRRQPFPASRSATATTTANPSPTNDRRWYWMTCVSWLLRLRGCASVAPLCTPPKRSDRGGYSQTVDEGHQGPGALALARLTFADRLPASAFAELFPKYPPTTRLI